jgi:hypothetical protein
MPEPITDMDQIFEKFDKIRETYASRPHSGYHTILLLGYPGNGKTTFLGTCRKPILLYSFDPGGASVLQPLVDSGDVLVRSMELENKKVPKAWKAFKAAAQEDLSSGILDHIGTLAVDSGTLWVEAMMNESMGGGGDDATPDRRDYMITANAIADQVKTFSSIPCDFILTAHLEDDIDTNGQVISKSPMLFKSLKARLPTLFAEKWVIREKRTPQGQEFEILTQTQGLFRAGTRNLGSTTRLPQICPADMHEIARMAGIEFEDKPRIEVVR